MGRCNCRSWVNVVDVKHWGEYLGDHLGATALVDRLLHHSHVIVINGPSYRDWEHKQ
ncbi:MAG: ATP-binding protein, partial [Deltaproteobacteria bacterium]|nr:ATP-binding protein [Nannocystaceae bacterium]